MKKVTFTGKPTKANVNADAWVETRGQDVKEEKIKRLTLDIPASLHSRIKGSCAARGTTIAQEMREILLQQYPE